MRGVRRGCVRLKGAVIGIDDEDDSTFTVTVDHKTFHFQARDAEERHNWVQALEETIFRHGNRVSMTKLLFYINCLLRLFITSSNKHRRFRIL